MNTAIRNTMLAVALLAPLSASAEGFRASISAFNLNPTSDNGALASGALDVSVNSETNFTVAGEYAFNDRWSVEVQYGFGFDHDVSLNGAKSLEITHKPLTVAGKYTFNGEKFRPYLGLGLNRTGFSDETEFGPIAGTNTTLDDSSGLAALAGVEFDLTEQFALRGEVRWIDMDTDVAVNGAGVGVAHVDPILVGVSAVLRF
ncbi:MAG: OmpW family protein [Xanthomonadales bacterium]|nr:OmpW family protein [Xanthomonadales bacterium]